MGHGRAPCRRFGGPFLVLCLLVPGSAARADALRPRAPEPHRLLPRPVLSDFGYPPPTSFSATRQPEPIPRVLPPLDLSLSDPSWHPAPAAPFHPDAPGLGLDSKIHIPEPASIVLLTTGLVGLIARRHLRKMLA